MMMIDVRDVADVHVALMRPGRGPKRYVCGGTMLSFDEMISALESGTGQHVRRIPMSPGVFAVSVGFPTPSIGCFRSAVRSVTRRHS